MNLKKLYGYWYTILFIVVVGGGWLGLLEFFSYKGSWDLAPLKVKIALPVFLISILGFFATMLADFFSHKDVKRPVLTGFALLFFNWIAILVYFWLVVHRREKT